MKRIITFLLATAIILGMISTFAVTVSAAPNDPEITVESGKTSELTGKQNFQCATVNGTLIIKENAVLQTHEITIGKNGKLITEQGSTITMTGGKLQCYGSLEINGKLGGNLKDLTITGTLSIGDSGAVNGLGFPNNPNGYAESVGYILKQFGCTTIIIKDAVYAFANGHKHTYQNGTCVNCGVSGCLLGESNHTYQNYVCSVCGAIDPAHPHNYEKGTCTICKNKCFHIFFDEYTHKCATCGIFQCDAIGHTFSGRNCTICNAEKCKIQGHSYQNGKCTVCGETCKNEFHNGNYQCPDCKMVLNAGVTASALSEGNLTIICSVACLAIGFLAAMFIFKKKKNKE